MVNSGRYIRAQNNLILLDSTSLYHGSTSLYLFLHHSNMALLHSTLLHITPPWFYFTLLDSIVLYHGSTSLYVTPPGAEAAAKKVERPN